MTAMKIAFSLGIKTFSSSVLLSNADYLTTKKHNVYFAVRNLSSLVLSKNMELLSQEKKNTKVLNLKLTQPQDKPLVVILSWLLAKRNHINKYANFYLDQGFDVLSVSITPWQLLWPLKGSQVVASDILKFLDVNKSYSPLVLHGFSVGGYLWGEVLVKMAQEQDKYQHIIDRTAGQVWDSAADITELPIGLPVAVFPKNVVLQNALKQYILYHMKTFDKVATCHYVRSSQMFHTNIIKAPTLVFLSKTDTIGAVTSNQRARENWENIGIKVYWKCFEDSPHVGHMYKYPKEYLAEKYMFLDNLGLIANPEKIKAKMQ